MAQSKTKSRTFRRIRRRNVSGIVTKYTRRRPSKAHCAVCGEILHGVSSGLHIAKTSKTERRPERPFGGMLCSGCSRTVHKKSARMQND